MAKRCGVFLAAAATLVAGVWSSQSISAPDDRDAKSNTPVITVVAPPAPQIIKKQAHDFVQAYAAVTNPNVDQIGRWHDPVCVMVIGLPKAEQAAKIKARIETMAHALGLPAASLGCKPNVEIAFEDDPQSAMNGVAKSDYVQYLLGYYHLSKADQLKTINHPIQAWYVTQTTGDAVNLGGLVGSNLPPGYYFNPSAIDDPANMGAIGCANRASGCKNSAFFNVLIVADNKALQGNKLSAVADDMVMLALSQPNSLDGCYAFPSIIDRFANTSCIGRTAPDELTSADMAYLSALYSADLESRKSIEQTDMAGRMAKILIESNAAASPSSAGSPAADAKGGRP